MNFFQKNKTKLLFLVVFTLPMYMVVNNVFLGLYIILCLFDGNFTEKRKNLKNNYKLLIPIVLFFCLALIASINNTESFFLKHVESYWSLLLIPFVVSIQSQFYKKSKDIIFKGLVYGSTATLIICYINVFYEMILKSEPISYFFRWRHLGHEFTEVADTHPAYLGIFIITSIAYLLTTNEFTPKLKIGLTIFFTLGLFQLAGRMALLINGVLILILVINSFKKYKKLIGLSLVGISILTIILFEFGSNYLTERIFSTNSIEKDYRFERQVVSYEIFKENPIFGLGFHKIKETRIEKYTEHGYIIAAHNVYNSHNQFMEYLSVNGIIGGFIYILIFGFLIIKSLRQKEYLFTFIFLSLVAANMTESMFVRIKGIEYFAIFATLFLSSLDKSLKTSHFPKLG